MEENVTLLAAFGAGLLSFLSPCVLPLIPGYLSYISGLSLDQMRGVPATGGGVAVAVAAPPEARRQVILASLAFILGFSLVFVALGASASYIGKFLTSMLAIGVHASFMSANAERSSMWITRISVELKSRPSIFA